MFLHPQRGLVEVEMGTIYPAADLTITVWLVDRKQARTATDQRIASFGGPSRLARATAGGRDDRVRPDVPKSVVRQPWKGPHL